jgi:hypothetical protein
MIRRTKIAIGIARTEDCGVIPEWNEQDWMLYIRTEAEKLRFGQHFDLSQFKVKLSKSNGSYMERMKDGEAKTIFYKSKKTIKMLRKISSKIIHGII